HMTGLLTDTRDCYDLLEDIRDQIKRGYTGFVFNLENVGRVTSCGIGLLAACYTSVKNANGKLCFAAAPEIVRSVVTVVGLGDVFVMYPTEEEAIRAAGE
ncbi:MAG: STAS domain-containing protein, partial [bacterium]